MRGGLVEVSARVRLHVRAEAAGLRAARRRAEAAAACCSAARRAAARRRRRESTASRARRCRARNHAAAAASRPKKEPQAKLPAESPRRWGLAACSIPHRWPFRSLLSRLEGLHCESTAGSGSTGSAVRIKALRHDCLLQRARGPARPSPWPCSRTPPIWTPPSSRRLAALSGGQRTRRPTCASPRCRCRRRPCRAAVSATRDCRPSPYGIFLLCGLPSTGPAGHFAPLRATRHTASNSAHCC